MKQEITETQWAEMSKSGQDLISAWKHNKGYTSPLLTLGQCIEFMVAISYNLHFDNSDGRFFNKILINNESVIAWEGDELIDILWFEITKILQFRLSRTFSEPLPA